MLSSLPQNPSHLGVAVPVVLGLPLPPRLHLASASPATVLWWGLRVAPAAGVVVLVPPLLPRLPVRLRLRLPQRPSPKMEM